MPIICALLALPAGAFYAAVGMALRELAWEWRVERRQRRAVDEQQRRYWMGRG